MKLWAGLYKTGFREQLAARLHAILTAAYQVLANQRGNPTSALRIEDTTMQGEDEDTPEA
jgi:hypothetical protein